MKVKIVLLSLGLLACSLVNGQIKIGDNPQNLDSASVLELESSSRVLVITRINTQQMEAIVPNPGALVYNTDTQCIHYFDGVQWANLCDSAELTFTADPIENTLSTIVITRNGDIINLEVAPNSIRTEQIVNGGVRGEDIQDNSIGPNKLADDSVGRDELSENAVGVDALAVDEFNLGSFANTPGFITGADIVSNDPDNALTDNGGAFYDDSVLQTAVAANTTAIANDGDTSSVNEIQNLALVGDQLTISGSNTVDLGVFNNTGSDEQDLTGASLNGANILQIDIENGNSATVDLSALAGTGTDNQNLTGATLSGANVLQINIESGDPAIVDLSPLAGGADGVVSNVVLNTTDLQFTGANGGFDGTVDLSSLVGTGADGVISNVALNTTDLVFTGANGGFDGTVDLSSLGGTGADGVITGVTLNGTDLEFSGTAPGFIGTVPLGSIDTTLDEATVDAFANNNGYLTVELDDDPTNELEIPGGDTNGQVLSSLGGGVYTWATITGGGGIDTNDFITGGNLNIENLELTGTGGAGAIIDLSAFALDTDIVPATIVSADTPNSITAGTDGGALYDDLDADPGNEIQTITSIDGSVTITPVGINDFDLSVPAGTDDQNIEGSLLTGEILTIGIEGGTNQDVSLATFALETELNAAIAASDAADGDTSDVNEIQAISSPDGSVTVNQVGNDYELTIPAAATSSNLGNTDFTLTENRTVNLNGNNFIFSNTGNIGMGVFEGAGNPTSPEDKLDVNGQIRTRQGFAANPGTANEPSYGFYTNNDNDTGMFRAGNNQIGFSTGGTEAMRIDASRNVGIGETNPQRNLHVGGEVQFDGDVYVSGFGQVYDVPDFVFQHYFQGHSPLNKEYQFKTLKEIEAFVRENHHLPGIKSATQVKEDGSWNLSESNLKNLEKIEELFLHTIEQEKKIEQLRHEKDTLAQQVQALQKDILEIKALLKTQKSKE